MNLCTHQHPSTFATNGWGFLFSTLGLRWNMVVFGKKKPKNSISSTWGRMSSPTRRRRSTFSQLWTTASDLKAPVLIPGHFTLGPARAGGHGPQPGKVSSYLVCIQICCQSWFSTSFRGSYLPNCWQSVFHSPFGGTQY